MHLSVVVKKVNRRTIAVLFVWGLLSVTDWRFRWLDPIDVVAPNEALFIKVSCFYIVLYPCGFLDLIRTLCREIFLWKFQNFLSNLIFQYFNFRFVFILFLIQHIF